VLAGYSLSLITAGSSFLAGIAIGQPIIGEIPFVPFYPAILVSALIGGLGPAAVALTISSALAWSYFLPAAWSTSTVVIALSTFVFVNVMNITLVLVLDAALSRVLAREHEVRTLMETAHNGILVLDEKGLIRIVNARAEKLFGYTRHELVGKNVGILVPERLVHAHEVLCASYMDAPLTRIMGEGLDLRARRKEGTEFPVEIALNSFNAKSGKTVLVTVLDVSERKKAAEQQQLLIRELNHRIQNVFAVFQSIIHRSLPNNSASRNDLLNRLQALSRAHSMLGNSAWEGANLDELVRSELDGFTNRRAVVTGCDLVLAPASAQSFALIVHELATNAAKHGALSVATGKITLTGSIDGENGHQMFTFRWIERNGPEVKVPTRRGFGSTVLIDAAKAFGARPRIEYLPEGLEYELVVRLTAIQAIAEQQRDAGGVRVKTAAGSVRAVARAGSSSQLDAVSNC
jgi:PAS domain S-box-containing protein